MNLSKIKELRKEKGLSQKRLANMLEVSPSYIQKIESNKKNPSISTLRKISSALNVDMSLLISNDNKNNIDNSDCNNVDTSSSNNEKSSIDSGLNLPSNIPIDILLKFVEYIDEDISIADKLNDIYLLESLYKYEFKSLKDTYEYRINKLDDENRKLRLALAYLEAENKKLNNKFESISSLQKENSEDNVSYNFFAPIDSQPANNYEDEDEEYYEDDYIPDEYLDYNFYDEDF